ncbi:MAG: 4-oxalocrotonate tautomerase [Zoogloeaceae bacterium]|nr:4-oxalocrotonate tautomerase [Pseudazoarcus pumilus]MDX5446187.1 4-oxalocrotonate tautomerase [Zoogloeaceae bacterium]
MPTYRVELFEGRTPEKKKELMEAITEASVRVLGCSADSVDVIIYDIPKHDWGTAGVPWSEAK